MHILSHVHVLYSINCKFVGEEDNGLSTGVTAAITVIAILVILLLIVVLILLFFKQTMKPR